ncbi:uncharacterized protein BCR38DRAFT_412332 [Pseudomassariella vexata]|uniref:Uncharacterized protein n=1 Tax=Pseudomassariella vexata TaxID=1141098 RepID=A0A1Y2DLX0_9PEZI|nr:uncharacterized protein BCR38DRAFT_412332 [Pseudomassariella vexata]ORY60136.1 hypothetical protein BCR38DRAFT_412332 [Pseudomassariella vexata]
MGAVTFFVNWELWQQMTFVLGCAIVLVFFAGLCKLWYMNRFTRKHILLDEEKKTRISEMQSSGLPVMKRADIPFGVRAIQSGIEVDGIWISRPGTPDSQSPLAAPSSMAFPPVNQPKGKERAVVYGSAATTLSVAEPRSTIPSPTGSTFERSSAANLNGAPHKSPQLGPQNTYKPKHSRPQSLTQLNDTVHDDTLRQLEGSYEGPILQTYIPTTSFSIRYPGAAAVAQQPTEGDRNSISSEEGLTNMRQNPRRKSPFPDVMRAPTNEPAVYYPERDSSDGSQRDPFATPEPRDRSSSGASRQFVYQAQSTHEAAAQHVMPEHIARPPKRSYSGDIQGARTSRRVNAGFEVMPGRMGEHFDFSAHNGNHVDLESGDSSERRNRTSRTLVNKLHKKNGRSGSNGS